ncbi:MAG TPA: tetratricopeptide repeat protein [Anaerohalosphaeraceae bacterium]|nr:tetratricopeptide repeat protein [Anaerohalosphaeraceae bacterium]
MTESERKIMLKILELIAADKMEEAARQLEKSTSPSSSAVFDFTLANIYFQQADRDQINQDEKTKILNQAATAYQSAVEKYPKFRRAWRNLGLIYIRQGQYDKSLPALTQVIALGGGNAITFGLLGFAYASVGNNLSAESAYRMAILLDPNTIDWKMGLARSFFRQERFSDAAALCKQLIRENPDRADLWLLEANARIGLNQPLQAAEIFELVDRLGKSTADSLNMLGDIYVNQELYDMAAEAYTRAMRKDEPGNPDRPIRSAQILIARGAFEETRLLIEQIETRYGSQLTDAARREILKLRARLAVAVGTDDMEEVRVLEEIVALDPLDGEALILLGRRSSRTQDFEKAIFYFERAAAIEKYEADAKIQHAQLLVQQGKYNEALPLLRRAQQISHRQNVQEYLEQVERFAKSR